LPEREKEKKYIFYLKRPLRKKDATGRIHQEVAKAKDVQGRQHHPERVRQHRDALD